MSRSSTASLLFAALLFVGCQGSVSSNGEAGGGGEGGGTTDSATTTSTTSTFTCTAPDAPIAFEIGTGEKCFERLTVDQEVPVQAGPQGGYHVWLAFGCNDCGTVVHLKYGVRDPATHEPFEGMSDLEGELVLHGKDWPQAAGIYDYMPGGTAGGTQLDYGTKILLWAEAYTPKGALWHQQEIEVTVGEVQ